MRDSYFEIYEMTPVKEVEPGWWRLKWKPIDYGTYHFYSWSWEKAFGLYVTRDDATNGWGRYYKRLDIRFGLGFRTFNFWIKWDYRVMAEGPLDITPRKPLRIPVHSTSQEEKL